MKRLLTALCITAALAFAVHAEDAKDSTDAHKKKHEPSPAMKELLTKYDANKDGKLDKEEMGKMSADDKAKFEKIQHRPHMKKEHQAAPAAPSSPAPTAPPATK